MRVACLYFNKPENTQTIAEVFYKATPQIMLRGDQALFLEISRSSSLFSEKSFLRRALATLNRLSVRAKVGIADDAASALCFAIYGVNEKELLPIEALRFYADPLYKDVDAVNKMTKTVIILKQLGIQTVGDFLKIPIKEISSRFGPLGLVVYLRILNQSDIAWKSFIPSEIVAEKHEFDLEYPVDNLEPIYFVLKALLDRMVLRLRGKGRRARQFDIVLKQEFTENGDCDYRVPILLQLPYVSNKVIFQIAKEKLEASVREKPFESRITEFSVIVTEETPYFMNQKDIFNQHREENEESFFQLVSRVATKLGQTAVFFAKPRESYLPEKNWLRMPELKELKNEVTKLKESPMNLAQDLLSVRSHLAERPLRLFSQPIEVEFSENRILLNGFTEEIEQIGNKEVVFSDWWENPLERIYYRLVTKSGKHLWLFRTTQGHFLHGSFD